MGLISRQEKGIRVENMGTMQLLWTDYVPSKATDVHFQL